MTPAETTTDLHPAPPLATSAKPRRVRSQAMNMDPRAVPGSVKSHSRFVHFMKMLLPATAAVLVILILIWPYLRTEDLRFRLSFAAVTANDSEDSSMVNPRYLGIDKENQAFSITADLARNLADKSTMVELEMPKADITLGDGSWLVLTAQNGIFTQLKKTLDLEGAVNLFHDSGYEFKTTQANIDLEKGLAEGNKAIRGQGPFGEMRGEGFRFLDKGKTIVFTGKSKLVIYPGLSEADK